MSQDIFRKILDDHKELSSLPQVLSEVIKVANNPKSSVGELARVVMKDPGLTAKLLRVVNSSYYAPISEISSVKQAVVSLGIRTVTAIALSSSIYSLVNRVDSKIDRKKFWRHSLEVALAARAIARAVGHKPVEEAFVAGLLHDIGALVLEASFPDSFASIWKLVEAGENLTKIEERNWNTNHARVGQFLLAQWKIPVDICEAVGRHHDEFAENDNTDETRLGRIIALANRISKFKSYNMPPVDEQLIYQRKILTASLGMSQSALGDVERSLVSEVVAESGYLEIDVGSIEEILAEANELLYNQYLLAEKLLDEKHDRSEYQADDESKTLLENLARLTERIAAGLQNENIFASDIENNQNTKKDTTAVSEYIKALSKIGESLRILSRTNHPLKEDSGNLKKLAGEIAGHVNALEKVVETTVV
jgi:putative nucleotidyltransferase with HDIG domain